MSTHTRTRKLRTNLRIIDGNSNNNNINNSFSSSSSTNTNTSNRTATTTTTTTTTTTSSGTTRYVLNCFISILSKFQNYIEKIRIVIVNTNTSSATHSYYCTCTPISTICKSPQCFVLRKIIPLFLVLVCVYEVYIEFVLLEKYYSEPNDNTINSYDNNNNNNNNNNYNNKNNNNNNIQYKKNTNTMNLLLNSTTPIETTNRKILLDKSSTSNTRTATNQLQSTDAKERRVETEKYIPIKPINPINPSSFTSSSTSTSTSSLSTTTQQQQQAVTDEEYYNKLIESDTSITKYIKTISAPHRVLLLKWDAHGILERTSPIDQVSLLPMKSLVQYFSKTTPSKYGKVALLLNSNVMIGIQWDIVPPIPFLFYTIPKHIIQSRKENFVLVPNPYDRDGFNRACIWDAEQNNKIPYTERMDIIVWRGSGHGLNDRHVLFELIKNTTYCNGWLNASNIDTDPQSRLERHEMTNNYKYQLDISGDAIPAWGGVRWKMCSGSLLFIVNNTLMDWWHNTIQPYVHYVPVQTDLHNLREQYEWVLHNPDESYRIMKRGQEVCKQSSDDTVITQYYTSMIQSLPSASIDAIHEADFLLNGYSSIWKKVSIDTSYDRTKHQQVDTNNNNNNNSNGNSGSSSSSSSSSSVLLSTRR